MAACQYKSYTVSSTGKNDEVGREGRGKEGKRREGEKYEARERLLLLLSRFSCV